MGEVSQLLRDSARGQRCCFRIPGVCNGDPETTVLAHIRDQNKGMANKADDWSGAFACSSCHYEIDQHNLAPLFEITYCLRALQETWTIWIEMGLIKIAGLETERKPRPTSSKSLPPRPLGKGR